MRRQRRKFITILFGGSTKDSKHTFEKKVDFFSNSLYDKSKKEIVSDMKIQERREGNCRAEVMLQSI